MSTAVDMCELYRSYCAAEGCRVNTAVFQYIMNAGRGVPLEVMHLGNNYLGPRGLRPIIRLVEYCQTMTSLNIDGNGANNDTVAELCEVLLTHQGMETVSLRGNPITVTGGKMLLQLVEKNKRITCIDLTDTDVFEALIWKISSVTSDNRVAMRRDAPQLIPTAISDKQLHQMQSNLNATTGSASQDKPTIMGIQVPAQGRPGTGTRKSFQTTNGSLVTQSPLPNISGSPQQDQDSKGGGSLPAVRRTQSRPPVPALASRELTRLPEQQRLELQRRYRDRAMLFREVNSSLASKVADRAREELMLLEMSSKNAAAGRILESAAVLKPLRSSRELNEVRSEAPRSASGLDTEHPQTTTDSTDNTQNRESRRQSALETVSEVSFKDNSVSFVTRPGTGAERGRTSSTDHTDGEVRRPPSSLGALNDTTKEDEVALGASLENSQSAHGIGGQLLSLFNNGCSSYVSQNLEMAYVSWNEAMGIAASTNDREWMAVLYNNLQRLSYEMLVRKGIEHLNDDKLEDADVDFQRALEIAQKAHNAKWEAEMQKARRDVQHAVFQRCHNSAMKLFEAARSQPYRKVTEDDYFVVPGTDIMIQHTEAYVNEWSCMLMIKEAVELWAASRRVVERIGGEASDNLLRIVEDALDSVAGFLVEHCCDLDEPQLPSWMRTSLYNYHECIMLTTLWKDMSSCAPFEEHHKLFAAVAAAQIGNFCLATYQLVQADTQFKTLQKLAEELNDPVLRGAGHMFSAIVYWQSARYSEAEALLRLALNEWDALRVEIRHPQRERPASHSENKEASAQMQSDSCNESSGGHGEVNDTHGFTIGQTYSRLASSLPHDYAATMEACSYKLLISCVTNTYRYGEALELLERSLVCKYRDLLYEKLKINFSSAPTLAHVLVTSSQIHSPLIYQLVTHRYDWSPDKCCYNVEEKLLMWVVPQVGEMRFMEVNVTNDFKVPSIDSLVEVLRKGLLLDPLNSAPSFSTSLSKDTTFDDGSGVSRAPTANVSTGNCTGDEADIILKPPRRTWMEPLQTLYAIFIDPIAAFLRALHTRFLGKNGVITIVPTGRLWLVPFNALIAHNGNYVVEDFAVQLAFCATQCSFCALSAKRVGKRDLNRDVVFVQREISALPQNPERFFLFPLDAQRSKAEGDAVIQALSTHKREVRQRSSGLTSVVMTNSEMLIEDIATLRAHLPQCRTLHIAAAATCNMRNVDTSAGALCVVGHDGSVNILSSSEISRMELFAEHVVLTNANMLPSRVAGTHDDVLGIVRGFFSSGVPCVITSQWCTPDMTPAVLFRHFYELQATAEWHLKRSVAAQDAAAKSNAVTRAVNTKEEKAEMPYPGGEHFSYHKALILAWAIRELLQDSSFRYSPRLWAGYCCIGYGLHS
ncbi:hypothetical protein TRVL_07673 [Trypanosoma vivax]|nr:hypothetical protein TRVL_07673 [Trypanosoma vivax]